MDIFFAILNVGKFWVLMMKCIFKEPLCIINIALTFTVFGTLGFKIGFSSVVVRSFNFSSASFLCEAAVGI